MKDNYLNYLTPGRFYLSGGAGVTVPMTDNSQYLPTGTGWPNDYYTSHRITNNPAFFLAGGYAIAHAAKWFPYYSAGLRYTYIPSMEVQGHIDQYSLPGFNNYSYNYYIQQQDFVATLKGDLVRWHNVLPYLMVGAGLSVNTTSNYEETATPDVTPRVNPDFARNTNFNFTYVLGGGLDYMLPDHHWWANLEYNYNHVGTIRTGNGANYETATGVNYAGLSLKNTLSASTVLLGLTYYLE
jgi:hypothetical protein